MTRIVADASIVAKWFIPEPGSEAAVRVQGRAGAIAVPDLLFAELASVLSKKIRRGELEATDGRAILKVIAGAPFEVYPLRAVSGTAFELALAHSLSVYDACYIALALALDAPLVTADEKMHRQTRGGELQNVVRLADEVE